MRERSSMGLILNGLPLEGLREYSRSADRRGCHSLWFPEIMFTDAFTPIALASVETRSALLGTGVVGPWSRSPVVMALTAATLGTLSGGRFVLGIGTQARPYVTGWHGRNYERPLRAMREYVTIVKRILAGETVTFEGEIFSVHNFRLTFPPSAPVPVYMAAVGPEMIELAGEIADGVIGALWSVEYVRDVVRPRLAAGAARAGRPLSDIAVTLNLPTLVRDESDAHVQHRGIVLTFATAVASSTAYADSVAAAGFGPALARACGHVARRDWNAAFGAISEEMVDALTLTGPVANVHARVAAYRAAGVDAVMAMPSQPGMFYPLYEGHLDGAPFSGFDYAAFTGSIERALEAIESI
jgi:probable F420-dependent oxidoreductase